MSKNTWELKRYQHNSNDFRTEVTVKAGEAWIAANSCNGSGIEVHHVCAGSIWREGPNELIGVFATEQAAQSATWD